MRTILSMLGKARLWILLTLAGSVIVVFNPFADPVVWRYQGSIDFGKFHRCIERDGSFGGVAGFGGYFGGGSGLSAETGEALTSDRHKGGLVVRSKSGLSDRQTTALDRCTRLN
ncbi:hypothetical protein [Qipengyuania flava]|nr:hypothetical protein [Qipengyuania flava]